MNEYLLANVRFYFAQSVFNSNCHFKSYERLSKRKNNITCVLQILSAMTLVLLVLQVIGLENKFQKLLNILAFLGMLITGAGLIIEIFNKDDKSREIYQHKIFAEKYKNIRDEYMSLIEEIITSSKSDLELREKKDNLQKRYSSIGENAPETSGDDYKKAQFDLGLNGNSGEQFTWADKEIDKFLPEKLRLNNVE